MRASSTVPLARTLAATLTMPVPSLPIVTDVKASPAPLAGGTVTFASSSPGSTAVT
jgi:hypothetical protein